MRQSLLQKFHKFQASKAKTKQHFEAAKDLVCQPGRAEQTGKAFPDLSGECFFVSNASNFTIFPQCFDKRI